MLSPAGDQTGEFSSEMSSVSRTSARLCTSTTYRSVVPRESETKARRVPSGDQAGLLSAASDVVTRRSPRPFASTM
jgi:hypothetical protein